MDNQERVEGLRKAFGDIVAGHMGKTYGDDKHGCHRNCPGCAQQRLWEWIIELSGQPLEAWVNLFSISAKDARAISKALGVEVKK